MGFVRYPVQPESARASARGSPGEAVRARMGMLAVRGCCRRRWARSKPWASGRRRSRKMRSGGGDPGDGERLQVRAGLEDGVSVPLQKLSQEFPGRWVVLDDKDGGHARAPLRAPVALGSPFLVLPEASPPGGRPARPAGRSATPSALDRPGRAGA